MDRTVYRSKIESLMDEVKQMPVHSKSRIDETARGLEDIAFTFTLGDLEADLFRLTNGDFMDLLTEVDQQSVNQLEGNPTIFDPSRNETESLEDWGRAVRWKRMEILADKYRFLIRLREDEPEAWDEVNELFYDD